MGRNLTSKKKRETLWLWAEGKCQICGKELEDDWEADHIIPWSKEHRTNMFEMQAVCRTCNRRKGMKQTFSYNPKKLRDGQSIAINVIKDRVKHNENYTAIILPTRYGKSDVIRLTAIELKELGVVSSVVSLSPNRYLRDQLVQEEKIEAMYERYDIDKNFKVKVSRHSNPSIHKLRSNNDHVVSITTQILQSRIDTIEAWVDSTVYKTGLPVLVYVDECHTNTEENMWGQSVSRLVDVGALVVLLTATAIRADNERIVGFKYIQTNERSVDVVRSTRIDKEKVRVDFFTGSKFAWKIEAHHETPFSVAWNEDPLPICHISRVPYDVVTDEFINGKTTNMHKTLSSLSLKETRDNLSRICKHPLVIAEGVKRLVTELKTWQRITPDIGAIVFCSNDKESDKDVNRHANSIKKAILAFDSSVSVSIATSADKEEGREAMSKFIRDGEGDILIVKQMAGVGVDCARLKIALDLSPVRTPASYTQRIMRIATPYNEHIVAVLITPDDILSQAMFAYCVTGQGGEANSLELELVKTEIKDRIESLQDKKEYLARQIQDSSFSDTFMLLGEPEMQIQVRKTKEKYPQLCMIMTDPQIANMILDHRNTDNFGVIDETAICDDYIVQLNGYAKMEALNMLRQNNTPYGTKEGKNQYGIMIKSVWKRWSSAVGQPNIRPVDKPSADLKRLLDHAIGVYNADQVAKAS